MILKTNKQLKSWQAALFFVFYALMFGVIVLVGTMLYTGNYSLENAKIAMKAPETAQELAMIRMALLTGFFAMVCYGRELGKQTQAAAMFLVVILAYFIGIAAALLPIAFVTTRPMKA